jgi:hypothetical protein
MRKISTFLAKLFFSLLFTLVLIEGGLRLFPQVVPLELLIYFADTPRGEIAQRRHLPTQWGTVVVERDDGGPELRIFEPFAEIVLPGREDEVTVVMDEMGFCNPPGGNYQRAKIQLIAVGDSFTTCHGVRPHETWTNQLASLSGVSVYNLGRGKSGLHEYLQLLKKFGLPKSPQLVIMNVYEGNDLRDAALYYYYRLNHGDTAATATSQEADPNQTFWQRYSYAYNLGAASLQYRSALNSASADLPGSSDPFLFPVSDVPERYFVGIQKINFKYQIVFPDRTITLNHKNADVDEVLVARHLYDKIIEPGVMQAVDAALSAFVELSKQYNFTPVVTYTPAAHTAYAASVVYEDPSLHTLMPWFSQQQRAYFQEKGEELGYFFVDLTPALQAAAQGSNSGELLYARDDLHLTPQGHRVVAKAINQALQDLKVLATRN